MFEFRISRYGSLSRVLLRADRSLDDDAESANLGSQGAARDTKDLGSLQLVSASLLQDAGQELAFHLRKGFGVQLLGAGAQPLRDELVPVARRRRRLLASLTRCQWRQKIRNQHGAGGLKQTLLEHTLQLAQIAGPGILSENLQRFRRCALHLFSQLAAESLQEMLHEERQIFQALTQRRQLDREDA